MVAPAVLGFLSRNKTLRYGVPMLVSGLWARTRVGRSGGGPGWLDPACLSLYESPVTETG